MTAEELQRHIDNAGSAKDMVVIAKAYLDGSVLYDPTAAEAWLLRAIETEDPVVSAEAMGLLAECILCKPAIPPQDAREIAARLETAQGEERETLLALQRLVKEKET